MIIAKGKAVDQPHFAIDEVDDPSQVARCRAEYEMAKRNSDWLQAHWGDLLPQAYGKFVAVAGQEAFVADTPEAAWAWAAATHPEDTEALVQYVRPPSGPRIYAQQR